MSDIQKVPALKGGKRPETGPMQFGDDWPGLFIRGDDAMARASILRLVLSDLISDLTSCHVDTKPKADAA
jgi:hypothetical protein